MSHREELYPYIKLILCVALQMALEAKTKHTPDSVDFIHTGRLYKWLENGGIEDYRIGGLRVDEFISKATPKQLKSFISKIHEGEER